MMSGSHSLAVLRSHEMHKVGVAIVRIMPYEVRITNDKKLMHQGT